MVKALKIVLVVLIFQFFYSPLLYPQTRDIQFEHITMEDGLSNNYVYCILQDSKGFMWFGTGSGLNRYDGYNFVTYGHEHGNTNSISENSIRCLYEDKIGNLWVGTRGGGLNRFYRDKETFVNYIHDPDNPNSLCNDLVQTIYQSRDGDLWIGTVGGLSRIDHSYIIGDSSKIKFDNYLHDPEKPYSLSHNHIDAIYEDNEGILWIGTEKGGLNKFNRNEKRFYYETNFEIQNNFIELGPWKTYMPISSIYGDPENGEEIIWVGTGERLCKFSLRDRSYLKYYPGEPGIFYAPEKSFAPVLKDQQGWLWIGTQKDGLLLFNEKQKEAISFKNDPFNPNSLNTNWILSLYQDPQGAIWVGTFGAGINRYDPKRRKFNNYQIELKRPESKKKCSITAIFEDLHEEGEIIWLGTPDQGLLSYNRKTKMVEQYPFEGKANYQVNAIYQDPEDPANIWVGCYGNGLLKFNRQTESFKSYKCRSTDEEFHHPNRTDLMSTSYLYSIHRDRRGILWLASSLGVYSFNPKTKEFIPYLHNPTDNNSVSDIYVKSILEDKSGILWFGTFFAGLNRFDPRQEKFWHYKNNPHDSLSLSSNAVHSIYQDKKGIIWIGTTKGLNKFNPLDESFTLYGKNDPLARASIMGIMEDNRGNLWFFTNRGISKFNPQSQTFHHYDVRDGLQGYDFNTFAYHKSNSGEMFFGGENGFNSFYPDSIKYNPHVPPVVITDFQLFNKTVLPGDDSPLKRLISEIDKIILSHNQNLISFEFATLDYTIPSKNQYAYQLEGIDQDWIYTDASRRFATYANLNPSEYVFRVKGSNNDGVWNEEGASVRIIITPPWWKTNLAYGLYILLIMSLIFGVYRFQIRRIRMRHQLEMEHLHAEKLEEVDRMKSHFFANISHEFRTPLTLILGPLERLLTCYVDEDSHQELKIMQRSARRLQRLINQLLDLSKLEAGRMKLQVRKEDIVVLIRNFVQAFESLAKLKDIQLKFYSKQEDIRGYIDREKLETIVNNLLSNAFKFTPEGGKVNVDLSLRGEMAPASSTKQSVFNGRFEIDSPRLVGVRKDNGSLGFVQIRISDTGRGIPADRLPNIFDRFYQVDDSYTRDEEGSGIGLALTKELVEFHKGEISVSSELGKGTTFIIRLPIEKAAYEDEEIVEIIAPPVSPEREKDRSKPELMESEHLPLPSTKIDLKISLPILLMVEDNPDMRTYIHTNLENEYRILEAANGKEGFEKCAKAIPDLVISDVMMPEMDGFQLCAKLKTDQRTSHIPVILLTARAAAEDRIGGLETGADDYIIKPFNARELQVRVRNLIEQRRKLRERYRKEGILQPQEIAVTSTDQRFLQKALEIVEQHLSDEQFQVDKFGKEIGMSRALLYRKLRALTDCSPSEFIRSLRLNHAAQLLAQHSGNVTEIAFQVGFNNLSYFARCFRLQFGVPPSLYAAKHTHS